VNQTALDRAVLNQANLNQPTPRQTPHALWSDMREAVHAEWTKLRTLSGTAWLLLAIVAMTVALSLLASSTVTCDSANCGQDPAKVALTGVEFGQAVAAVLGVLAIGGEYNTGMIRVTLAAMPRRSTVLAAKAIVVGALALAAGIAAVLVSVLAAGLILPGHGFTGAHGFTGLSLTQAAVLRATVGSALYLALIALLGVGVAAMTRDSGASIGIVLGLLYIFPIVIAVVSNPRWHKDLQQIAPLNAGLAVQSTVNMQSQPIGPWAGLCVLAAWAVGALLLGGILLRLRDA
jgi:ABC-2 type transport system permease protein